MTQDWMRQLPDGRTISALGFGCAGVWSQPYFDESIATKMVADAVEYGCNHFDTSPSYGMTTGERRLSSLLQTVSRDRLFVSTKVGSNVIDGNLVRGFSIPMMEASFDASMKRLRTDHVDILYLHGPSPADLNDDVFEWFDRLKRSGRIKYSGVNSFDSATLEAVSLTPIDAVMLQYNVDDQSAAVIIDLMRARGKLVISGTAMGQGWFLPGNFIPRDRASLFYLARALKADPLFLVKGRRLRKRLEATGESAATAAIQFVTGHPGIASTLFSTRSPERLRQNIIAGQRSMDEGSWLSLRG